MKVGYKKRFEKIGRNKKENCEVENWEVNTSVDPLFLNPKIEIFILNKDQSFKRNESQCTSHEVSFQSNNEVNIFLKIINNPEWSKSDIPNKKAINVAQFSNKNRIRNKTYKDLEDEHEINENLPPTTPKINADE